MIDKILLFKYHQYLHDTNSNISYNTWIGKSNIDNDEEEEITKEEVINKIIDIKDKKKGVKKLYGLFQKYYKDKDEYEDILN